MFGFGSRHEHLRTDFKPMAHEFPPAGQVGEGFADGALPAQRLKRLDLFSKYRLIAMREQPGPWPLADMLGQSTRIQPVKTACGNQGIPAWLA